MNRPDDYGDYPQQQRRKKTGRSPGASVFLLSLCAAALALISFAVNTGYNLVSGLNFAGGSQMSLKEIADYQNKERDESLLDSDENAVLSADERMMEFLSKNGTPIPAGKHGIVNIMLIGVDCDNYEEKYLRSDSMILLSIDKQNRQLKMTSFMRDMRVSIPTVGKDKLNAAFAYDPSCELLFQTIEKNFRVPVDKFVCVNYDAFQEVISLLDGVDIEVSERDAKALDLKNWSPNAYQLKDGRWHLDGHLSLCYSRMRIIGDDPERTARQRRVLTAMFEKAKQSDVTKIVGITNAMTPHILTNLSVGEIFSLVASLPEYASYEILDNRLPLDGYWDDLIIDKIWYVDYDPRKNTEALIEFIYGKDAVQEFL